MARNDRRGEEGCNGKFVFEVKTDSLTLLHFSNNGMQAACPCRLRAHNLGNLELSFGVRRPHNGLEFSVPRRFPCIVPDHPGVGRHRRFDLTLVPGAARVEAQFHFADAVWPAECDAAKDLLVPAECLVVAGTVDTGKDFDGAVVGPAFTLPVALIVSGIDFDFDDPFYILDAVEARHDESDRKPMFFRQFLAVHQEGEHHVVLHSALERNAVVVAIDSSEHHIARGLFIGAGILEEVS